MTLGFQARAQQRALDRMGQRALLRGAPAGKVHLAKNVDAFAGQLGTADDNMMVRYTVVTISNAFAPKTGNALVFVDVDDAPIPGEAYVLDRLVQDNGYTSRYIVATA